MRWLLLWLLLAGYSPALVVADGVYVEVAGNVQHRTGASDWVMTDGNGVQRDYVGQVTAAVGYEWRGWSVFAGWSHLSFPEYRHDRGLNSQMLGVSYRWRL